MTYVNDYIMHYLATGTVNSTAAQYMRSYSVIVNLVDVNDEGLLVFDLYKKLLTSYIDDTIKPSL